MPDLQSFTLLLSQFHFIRPGWLLTFIPFGGLLYLRWKLEARPAWTDIIPPHLRTALTLGEQGWRRQLPLKLLALIIGLAIVICAGPTWQREASPFGEDKAALVIVLDNSDSMLATDLPPSRLERSKQKIRDLLALRAGGKTGLIVYAGSAHIAMPLTQDSAVFNPFLAAITPEVMPKPGKAAETTLPAIETLLQEHAGGTVLFISDGITPKAIDAFATFFTAHPYQLLVYGAGNPAVVSKNPMDTRALKSLAAQTDGRFVTATVDQDDLTTLNSAIERHMQLNSESAMPWQDMGYPLVALLALLMLLWFRKGWVVQWCFVGYLAAMIFALPTPTVAAVQSSVEPEAAQQSVSRWNRISQWWMDLWLTPDQQGQRLFNQLQYLEAARHYRDPLRKGIAYYYASEFKLAHTEFLEVGSDWGDFYAASALARQREYLAARTLLRELAERPNLDPQLRQGVANNLQVISTLIEDINRMSESQTGTPDGPDASKALGDQPQTAEGAQETATQSLLEQETLNAEQILGSTELADKWLKRVNADPKVFLSSKFMIQLREQEKSP
ncbi:VWA domain-containing protein [Photobacterium sp. TY1-4]|uniref:VWA domain-containing protein n=1 Tax=Photobacterium sp. TY1-4 TaxID=2899122 RepID=UPI0021C0D4A8|nr:VWA domain-containing protein [Photobacterium sp. TY1-4]UXI04550.1 VWA domain-containing protein [Photobacterium sp. TY1-4]